MISTGKTITVTAVKIMSEPLGLIGVFPLTFAAVAGSILLNN